MFSIDLDVRECGDHAIVALRGELDLADAADVAAALTATAAGRRVMIVDLAGLKFIDCCGTAALARVQRQAGREGRHLLLVAPCPRVQRVFELSRLIDPASVHASLAGATAACRVSATAGQDARGRRTRRRWV
jgi:anti-sigma B factor antagonist